ncbi:DUF4252 domain-containing protein [Flavobacterium salilacus subsp. salilacus]|uniref:DUF4252 domain-containing protein n=1 Tax=Flavobacterium TaxID=237 RepID=UPI0010755297|nr:MULTISPECIES: DUF4252 domain-containing protein [Flavobacterium]KAF2518466.1 DUF4252 domain-containing protein [Flavobacterium salilacus subsp. salilacus]MBE1615105.1 DUF4252 domain-containing protein [Flavobacterium sp. SaA2.13]
MKKILIAFVLLLMPSLFFAQSAFDKFDGKDGVTAIIVSKKMFELMGNVEMDKNNKDAQQYFDLIKKLDNLKIFTTSDGKAIADMKTTVAAYLKKYPLEELMRVNDSGKIIKIYVKSGSTSSQVKELLMFIEGGGKDETVLMTLTGNFDLSEITILTDKMNLPGGNHLRKASKKS